VRAGRGRDRRGQRRPAGRGRLSLAVDWDRLVAYADRLSVRPGERLRVMVSSVADPEAAIVRLPGGEPAPVEIDRLGPPRLQPVVTGAAVEAPFAAELRPADGIAVSVWLWLPPGAPAGGRRALVSSWSASGADGWALTLDAAGRPCFEVAAEGRGERVVADRALPSDRWWLVRGELDPEEGTVAVAAGAGEGLERPFASGSEAATLTAPGSAAGPVLLAAELREGRRFAHLDGKLEAPEVRAGRGSERLVAAWSLGAGRGGDVPDGGPHDLRGRCVNGPLRAVTGRSWSGDVHDWRFAPDQYDAMHFHSDATDDLEWEPTLELEVPPDLESGVYAVALAADGAEDLVPFVVRRPEGSSPAPYAVLLPTFTYLAYSCERDAPRERGELGPEDEWVARNRLRSLYDRFDDGCGVYEASTRRPLTQLRPGYRCPQHGGPHGLAQDLILLGFLERRGFVADVVCDHDVHAEGATALVGHRTVITGAHPEYATAELLDALDAHVGDGGRLAYLGGNGLNGRVSVDLERPHVAELRRNETQGLAWQALPGEHHHASTGAYGGDWRRQGRPEHGFLGVGLSAFGDAPAASYERLPVADPAAAVAFEGIEPGEPIGCDGAVLGGAAGFEVDNHDPVLGSPADSVRLASAAVGPAYSIWPDDVRDGADVAPKRRADVVLRRPPGGGAVFSVGSIAWSGCLVDDDNPVARVTGNVLRELGRDRPFEAGDG